MFQAVQMGNLYIQKGNNEYLPNHASFQRICCVHNNLSDSRISNCTNFQFGHANLPFRSHLRHPNLLQKPQFPTHRVQPILACQIRFVLPIALSWQSDEFYQRMDPETMNRQVPSHKFRTHTLACDHIHVALYKLASNPFSILVTLNIWLALVSFYSLASSTLALDNLVFANWSFHHRSYA